MIIYGKKLLNQRQNFALSIEHTVGLHSLL